MNIPDISTCAALMEQYGMLPNIRAHSLMVARIADLLANTLVENVDQRQLCVSGALLHDIAKTPCLNNSCDHAAEGAKICTQHGYPAIAEIVAEHVILPSYAPERYQVSAFSAQDLVYYADKRVRHDSIVSLAQRLEYILDKYGGSDAATHERIRNNFNKCEQLEEYLFFHFDFLPEQLAGKTASNSASFSAFPG